MKNIIVIGLVVAMAVGVVIIGSTLTAVLAPELDFRWRERSTAVK